MVRNACQPGREVRQTLPHPPSGPLDIPLGIRWALLGILHVFKEFQMGSRGSPPGHPVAMPRRSLLLFVAFWLGQPWAFLWAFPWAFRGHSWAFCLFFGAFRFLEPCGVLGILGENVHRASDQVPLNIIIIRSIHIDGRHYSAHSSFGKPPIG